MNVIVMNTSFEDVAIIDCYESLIWTKRYAEYGDFELYLPANQEINDYLKQDYYLRIQDSNCVMIIEGVEFKCDVEEGDHLIVTGRSLESILCRRIVWDRINLKGSPQNEIKKLIESNIGIRSTNERRVDNFEVLLSTDPLVLQLENISAQFFGDNLYDAVVAICSRYNLGFEIVLSADNTFVFSIYLGLNRTREQNTNPICVFSPKYDTLISDNYRVSSETLKSIALVAGEGEGVNRKSSAVELFQASGINRRELYVDARDISSQTNDGNISNSEYIELLEERGLEKLLENIPESSYNSEPIVSVQYVLGKDYDIGDVVEIENFSGLSRLCRITEITISDDANGYKVYPTFAEV